MWREKHLDTMPVTVHRDVGCAEGSGQSHSPNYQPIITTAPWYWVSRAAIVFQLIMQIPPFCYYLCFACEDTSCREMSLDTSTIPWIHHTQNNFSTFEVKYSSNELGLGEALYPRDIQGSQPCLHWPTHAPIWCVTIASLHWLTLLHSLIYNPVCWFLQERTY